MEDPDQSHASVTMLPVVNANDTKSMERLMERRSVKDYVRIGLVSSSVPQISGMNSRGMKSDTFRVTTVNSNYSVCHR